MNKIALAFLFIFGVGVVNQQTAPTPDDIVLENCDHFGGCGCGKGGKDKGDGK